MEEGQQEFEVCVKCGALITPSNASKTMDGGHCCALCTTET